MEALARAVNSSGGNPQLVMHKLEDFLNRFPESRLRAAVMRAIFKQAMQSNDPMTAAAYAEKLLALEPDDFDLVATLVDLLDRQSDPASHAKALQCANHFLERTLQWATQPPSADVAAEKWTETRDLTLASAYVLRAKAYEKAGDAQKSRVDFEKSFSLYPTAQMAERLGDIAGQTGDVEHAINYYLTAFSFPEKAPEPARREEVRRKLGSVYIAKFHSEKGLGDLVLARYDELSSLLKPRWQATGGANDNIRDPFEASLLRPDGSRVKLADYRGKVLVMSFWATWCGPCRLEGRLLEQVVQTFRNEPSAVFLAVNVDADRDNVPKFLREQQWTLPVVYAEGLDQLLGVHSLPTLLIVDRAGKVIFRQEGVDPDGFEQALEKRVRDALQQAPAATS